MLESETGGGGEHQVVIPSWKVFVFQLFTVLSYVNSAVNPLLYVFVNENFRQNCIAAVGFPRSPPPPPPPAVVRATPTVAERPRIFVSDHRAPGAAANVSACGSAMELRTRAIDDADGDRTILGASRLDDA